MRSVVLKAILSIVGVTLAGTIAGCGTESIESGPFEVPPNNVETREFFHFTSLAEMVKASEVIVIGTVADVAQGRTLGQNLDAITFRDVTVSVDTILKGSPNSATIHVEEEGFDSSGKPYSLNGSRWAKPEAKAIFFLVQKVNEPGKPYRLTNSQSRFFLYESKVIPNRSAEHEAFEQDAGDRSEEQFIAEVRRAVG